MKNMRKIKKILEFYSFFQNSLSMMRKMHIMIKK
jgi:hypothetical protein